MKTTDKELGFILAALRFVQQTPGRIIICSCMPQMDGLGAMSAAEIDELCDKLNREEDE